MNEKNRILVRIAEMAVVTSNSGTLVTHALGSCIAVTVFDPVARVSGLLHFMLPSPTAGTSGNRIEVGMQGYGASAVPALFRAAYAMGADKDRMVVCAVGGAERIGGDNGLRIGARNWAMLRKLLWKNGIILAATDVGGESPRNLSLDLATGAVEVTSSGITQRLPLSKSA